MTVTIDGDPKELRKIITRGDILSRLTVARRCHLFHERPPFYTKERFDEFLRKLREDLAAYKNEFGEELLIQKGDGFLKS